MTTYNPPLDLFKAQVESLSGQTHGNWICLVSDDNSRPDVYAAIREELDGDERFVLSQTESRLGYYRNFERALGLYRRRPRSWRSAIKTIGGIRTSSNPCAAPSSPG